MNLYFLRHAVAVERGAPGYSDDSQRPLTAEGRKKMRRIAKGIKALKLSFDLVLSSPYVRARETAEMVSSKISLTENLAPGAPFEKLIREINARSPKPRNVLLVGHEPDLSRMVSFLLAGRRDVPMDFKKGGLCCISAGKLPAAGCATLQWFLAPSQLRML